MNTLNIKSDLIRIIDSIDDINILKALKVLLINQTKIEQTQEVDFWDELPDQVKQDIDEALEQSEKGMVAPHEQVMKQIKEKYHLI